ncbi:hypothetical protein C7974DRAFT_364206 [Boeremia exigua]|uniref:uncharacterized protein n=1 Tax=Boeremia exigua TaxID=749465 RepID=UPI001E8EC5F6|nr:uncharacterized protein C7974DRAFT_364206 [Boeremia exigua]KAH6620551.1 hypothetical protein C7974DRAFT_364206 [Boeremia exigua]
MADPYTSHFSLNNIPYGIGSSTQRPSPQAVTRINDSIIFLAELSTHLAFSSIHAQLPTIFSHPTLNALAALPHNLQSEIRAAIRKTHTENPEAAAEPLENVTLHLPLAIGDFTDYSASANHVLNAGEAILGVRQFPPAFHAYPVGYAGRCSSIVVSGTPITRPLGQYLEDPRAAEKKIVFGASRALDYEFEVGAIIGQPVAPGTFLHAKDADKHIFGLVLVNDWSARDIQGLEMNPLGPFNGKNFGTSVGPWVVTLDALKAHEVAAPERMKPVAPFMDDEGAVNYDIRLTGAITRGGKKTTTCEVGFETMYWTFRHMLAHHVVGGCGLRTGDLIASGTVSGEQEHEHGCLLELTKNGKQASKLSDGSELRYLADGDEVTYEAIIGDGSAGIGFGACVGVVKPARQV